MNACDACDLSRDAENYGSHNCFEVIKQSGRSDLAALVLRKTKDLSETEAWKVAKEILFQHVGLNAGYQRAGISEDRMISHA